MDEYITREQAATVFKTFYGKSLRVMLEALEEEHAADVRPVVKAHWYWDKDGMDWNIGAWCCSACKAMSPMWWNTDRGSPMHKSGHKFCPNCGADMRPTSMSGANGEES